MLRRTLFSILAALCILAGPLHAAGDSGHVEDFEFSFEGLFGSFDQHQLQRGLQIYTEVCSACHGLRQVAFRNLGDLGGPHMDEDQVKAYAKQFEVFDPDLDDTREAKPADRFPGSLIEEAPDLSLMAKARAGFHGPYGLGLNQLVKGLGGPEYIASLMTGYTGKEKEEFGAILYENTAFAGGWISMAPPLEDGIVEFRDDHSNDVHHMAEDVAAFLMWAAEPKMTDRKSSGFIAVLLLVVLTALLYLANKKLWASVKRGKT